MASFNDYMQLIQSDRQAQNNDLSRIDSGVRGLGAGIVRAQDMSREQAELNRPMADPIQKFLNHMMAGKMSPEQAAKAYKLVQAGHLPADAFDADPNTPGVQAPPQDASGGYVGGAAPGMQGAPGTGGVIGPVSPQYTPQSQGGLAAPAQMLRQEEVQAPPPPQEAPFTWTTQSVNDLAKARGIFPDPRTGMSLADRLILQKDLFDRKGVLQDDNQGAKDELQQKRLDWFAKKHDADLADAQKNRDAAMERVIAQLKQSNINNMRTNGTAEDIQFLRTQEQALAALTRSETELENSENLLYNRPQVVEAIQQRRQQAEALLAKVQELRKQVEERVRKNPSRTGTSNTSIETKPTPSADSFIQGVLKRK